MANRQNKPSAKMIVQRLLIAFMILSGCILFSLYLLGFISIDLLDNIKFKILVSLIVISLIIVYFVAIYAFNAFKITWRSLTLIGLICEGLGFWWLANPFGYLLIIVGLVFLILGVAIEYRGEPPDQ